MTIGGPYSPSWCRRAGGCSSVIPSRKSTSSHFHAHSIHVLPLRTTLAMQATLIVHGSKISTTTPSSPLASIIQAPAAKTPLMAFRGNDLLMDFTEIETLYDLG